MGNSQATASKPSPPFPSWRQGRADGGRHRPNVYGIPCCSRPAKRRHGCRCFHGYPPQADGGVCQGQTPIHKTGMEAGFVYRLPMHMSAGEVPRPLVFGENIREGEQEPAGGLRRPIQLTWVRWIQGVRECTRITANKETIFAFIRVIRGLFFR
jgi:hypothetical protein